MEDGGAPADGSSAPRTAAPCKANGFFGTLTMYECDPTGMEGKTAQSAPLVVAMHGYTQGAVQTPAMGQPQTPAWGYMSTTQWAILAETYKFYVIFPDTGYGAPSFDWYESFVRQRGLGDSASIVSMVTAMQQAHNIDPKRVFANGLSSGAYMTVALLAEYPDVFAGGSTFEGGAYGCDQNCAALGKAGMGWTWPGNHSPSLVTAAYPTVWSNPSAHKPSLLVFQGENDGAVTPDNMNDLVQQWTGALGIPATPANGALGIPTTLSGQQYTVYASGNTVELATVYMPGVGHGTPVQPGPPQSSAPYFMMGAPQAADQGGWDPMPSKEMVNNANLVQDWTNTTGIYGPYYSLRFWGLVP